MPSSGKVAARRIGHSAEYIRLTGRQYAVEHMRRTLASLASLSFAAAMLYAQAPPTPEYSIEAIRFGTIPQFRTASLVVGADPAERIDIATVVWLIRGGGRNILFDTGFHRQTPGFDRFKTTDYIRPDEAVKLAGVEATQVTDVIISHVHWDHMGGLDLFPEATVWIQRDEYDYYMGRSWQPGETRGADVEDLVTLLKRNAAGKVRLVDGDDREIIPGIRAYTGARHTFASQYIRVAGTPSFVLASDNCYLYRNLETTAPIAQTFTPGDRAANVAAFERMITLAGARERVIPGHDPLQFARFKTIGRVATIK
jgi:glyoxylase-like metal-dependent hydrolase (beta-lactamase superfamily II)